MVGCHRPVCLVCLWPPAAFSFDQSLLWTAPFWTTLSVGYKRSKRARKDTDGKLLDSCKLAESCDLIFYLWPAPLICVARPSQPRLTPASSHNKIRAAPIWCRNKVAWKLFFLKNWGSMERTLADIHEGANRVANTLWLSSTTGFQNFFYHWLQNRGLIDQGAAQRSGSNPRELAASSKKITS